jgi:Zn-dependent peptidase ImmA (M78 family)/DNA-binding XRE family transcriptional regulator
MAGHLSFQLSPAVLNWARTSMGYTIEDAAKKVGVSVEQYEAWETGKKLPTYKQLEGLAEKVYKRPIAILLLQTPPLEEPVEKQFRSLSNDQVRNLPPDLRLGLRKAARYQSILAEVNPTTANYMRRFKLSIDTDPEIGAANFRNILSFPLTEQMSWKPEEAFRQFQSKIETFGVYVFKMDLPMPLVRAFCLKGAHPIIVLNKQDSKNGMIFSLLHETCHLLMDESDLFNDEQGSLSSRYARVEDFCNRFAASFLVPDEDFRRALNQVASQKKKVADGVIQQLSKRYNVSQEVIARKLLALRYINEEFFWKHKALWDAAARAAKEKQNEALKESDKGINQGIKVIFEMGKPYVANVLGAYEQGMISSSDLSDYLETKLSNIPKILERLSA